MLNRSKRWLEFFAEAKDTTQGMGKWLKKKGQTAAKYADSMSAWYAHYDLKAIRRSDYRGPGDHEIRMALDDAREATHHLADLLFKRERADQRAREAKRRSA